MAQTSNHNKQAEPESGVACICGNLVIIKDNKDRTTNVYDK